MAIIYNIHKQLLYMPPTHPVSTINQRCDLWLIQSHNTFCPAALKWCILLIFYVKRLHFCSWHVSRRNLDLPTADLSTQHLHLPDCHAALAPDLPWDQWTRGPHLNPQVKWRVVSKSTFLVPTWQHTNTCTLPWIGTRIGKLRYLIRFSVFKAKV